MTPSFDDEFEELFRTHFPRLYRYLNRLSGDHDLAADLTQDAFVRLYRRGSAPDTPEAWLITVATNLFRNSRAKESRRRHLLRIARGNDRAPDPPPSAASTAEANASRRRVRSAIDRLPERERALVLLRAEGYSYRDIAAALTLQETSVGSLLARAKHAFRRIYDETPDAS